jgi:hypothetical protein
MLTLNATTSLAHFQCLQEERIQQAEHERLVRQVLQSRRSRISGSEIKSESGRPRMVRPLNEASHPRVGV